MGFIEGKYQITASAGFGADPGRVVLATQGLYHVDPSASLEGLWGQLSLGPLVQVGLINQDYIVATTMNARSSLPFPNLPVLKVTMEGGLGLLLSQEEGEALLGSFLLVVGGGMDHRLASHLTLSVKTLLNFAVGPAEDFFLTTFLGLSYHF